MPLTEEEKAAARKGRNLLDQDGDPAWGFHSDL